MRLSQFKTVLDIKNKPTSVFLFRANINVLSSHTPALADLKNPIHPELKGD